MIQVKKKNNFEFCVHTSFCEQSNLLLLISMLTLEYAY